MDWRFLITFLLVLFLIKEVKADLVTPVIYSQLGIMALSPSTAIKVIIVDWVTDFVLLLVALFLIKFNIKKELKRIFLASFIGLFGGLLADIMGVFGGFFDYFVPIPIFMFTVSFAVLYGVYHLISKHLIKVDKKKIKIVAIFMAIFTNPVWLTLINASLFYPDYFVPKHPGSRYAWCEAKKVEYCFRWSQISPDYAEDKRPADWDTIASGCKDIGIGSPTLEQCKEIV